MVSIEQHDERRLALLANWLRGNRINPADVVADTLDVRGTAPHEVIVYREVMRGSDGAPLFVNDQLATEERHMPVIVPWPEEIR